MFKIKLLLKKTVINTFDFFFKSRKFFRGNLKSNIISEFKDIVFVLDSPLGMGDIIMLAPFLKHIEDNCPEAEIHYCTKFNNILSTRAKILSFKDFKELARKSSTLVISPASALGFVRYWFYSKKYIGFFWSFSLKTNLFNLSETILFHPDKEHYLHQAEIISTHLELKFETAKAEFPDAVRTSFEVPEVPYVVVAPYCNWQERMYPRTKWIQLLHKLKEHFFIVIVGSDNSTEILFNDSIVRELGDKNFLNLTGKTNIQQLSYILSMAKSFVGNDSGVSHLSFLSCPKSIVIYGCVPPGLRVPLSESSRSVVGLTSLEKCSAYSCYNFLHRPTCHSSFECTNLIPVDYILNQILT